MDIAPYKSAGVDIDTLNEFEIGRYYEADVAINYIISNQEKKYEIKISGDVSA